MHPQRHRARTKNRETDSGHSSILPFRHSLPPAHGLWTLQVKREKEICATRSSATADQRALFLCVFVVQNSRGPRPKTPLPVSRRKHIKSPIKMPLFPVFHPCFRVYFPIDTKCVARRGRLWILDCGRWTAPPNQFGNTSLPSVAEAGPWTGNASPASLGNCVGFLTRTTAQWS